MLILFLHNKIEKRGNYQDTSCPQRKNWLCSKRSVECIRPKEVQQQNIKTQPVTLVKTQEILVFRGKKSSFQFKRNWMLTSKALALCEENVSPMLTTLCPTPSMFLQESQNLALLNSIPSTYVAFKHYMNAWVALF